MNRGCIHAGERLYQLKALQDNTRATEYLKLARELPGYGEVVFPHCACDSRKGGHVIVAIGSSSLKLHACREDGTLESQVVELQWDCVSLWEADDEAMAFCLKYNRPDKTPRWLKIFTPYVRQFDIIELQFYPYLINLQYMYLLDCFQRIMEECKWVDTGE